MHLIVTNWTISGLIAVWMITEACYREMTNALSSPGRMITNSQTRSLASGFPEWLKG